MSVYMWFLNDTHTYLERQVVNNVYCVIISDVFESPTNIESLLNMHDMYMHCILYSNGHMLTYTC
jgi:hypothetical protein